MAPVGERTIPLCAPESRMVKKIGSVIRAASTPRGETHDTHTHSLDERAAHTRLVASHVVLFQVVARLDPNPPTLSPYPKSMKKASSTHQKAEKTSVEQACCSSTTTVVAIRGAGSLVAKTSLFRSAWTSLWGPTVLFSTQWILDDAPDRTSGSRGQRRG